MANKDKRRSITSTRKVSKVKIVTEDKVMQDKDDMSAETTQMDRTILLRGTMLPSYNSG